MPRINVLGKINHFLDSVEAPTLELTFAQLTIQSFHQGQLLNCTVKENAKLRVHLPGPDGLAQMEVLDNLVFHFTFGFIRPTAMRPYHSKMLNLPRPLMDGLLLLDAEQLLLEFTIDTPNKDHNIQIQHRYTSIMKVRQLQIGDTTCGFI